MHKPPTERLAVRTANVPDTQAHWRALVSDHPAAFLRRTGLLACGGLLLLGACTSTPPPTDQMAVSRAAVANAASAGGNELAAAEMRVARDKLSRATDAMAAKDYDNARMLAQQAQVDAQLAATRARSAKSQLAADELQRDSRALQEELDRKARPQAVSPNPIRN